MKKFYFILCAFLIGYTVDSAAQSCVNVGYIFYIGSTNQISFNIVNSTGSVVFEGAPGIPETGTLCLPEDCYTIHMYSTSVFGGWQGAHLDLAVWAVGQQSYTLNEGSFGVANFGIGLTDCTTADIFGCIDPLALNFNPAANFDDGACEHLGCTDSLAYNFNSTATVDDGSCMYCDQATGNLHPMYICTFGNGADLNFVVLNSVGDTIFHSPPMTDYQVVNSLICLNPDECYTVVMSNNAGQNGWNDGFFNIGFDVVPNTSLDNGLQTQSFIFGVLGQCGLIPGCTSVQAYNYNPLATIDDGSCYFVFGCTDSTAANYNPAAVIDDGSCFSGCSSGNLVQIIYTPDEYTPNEGSFYISDAQGTVVFGSGAGAITDITTLNVCLENGCYDLNVLDLYGDGWQGFSSVPGVSVLMNGDTLLANIVPEYDQATAQFGINSDCTILPAECSTIVELVPDSLVNALNSVFIYWNQDLNEVQSVLWDFGNGDFSNAVYPIYFYDTIGTYTVCATVTFADGCTTTNCVTFTIDETGSYGPGGTPFTGFWLNVVGTYPASVSEFTETKNALKLFPNPTNGLVHLQLANLNTSEKCNARVFSMDGREVTSTQFNNNSSGINLEMNVSELKSGYYMLVLQNGNEIYRASFVKE
jgi:hypothetical protein